MIDCKHNWKCTGVKFCYQCTKCGQRKFLRKLEKMETIETDEMFGIFYDSVRVIFNPTKEEWERLIVQVNTRAGLQIGYQKELNK